MNLVYRHVVVVFGAAIIAPHVHGIAKTLLGAALCLYGVAAIIASRQLEQE